MPGWNDRADLFWKRASAQRAEAAVLRCRLDAHVLRGATSEKIPPRYLRDVLRFTARIAWLRLRAWTNSLRAGTAAHRAELAALAARETEHAESARVAVLSPDERARRAGLGP